VVLAGTRLPVGRWLWSGLVSQLDCGSGRDSSPSWTVDRSPYTVETRFDKNLSSSGPQFFERVCKLYTRTHTSGTHHVQSFIIIHIYIYIYIYVIKLLTLIITKTRNAIRSQVSSVDTAVRLQAGRPRNRSSIPAGTRHFSFSIVSVQALGPTELVTRWVLGTAPLGIKLTERGSKVQNSKATARLPHRAIQQCGSGTSRDT
jgi:hypothetical protein